MNSLRKLTALFLALAVAAALLTPGLPLRAGAEEENPVLTVSDIRVNPLYADILTEEDLNKPQDPPVPYSDPVYLTSTEEAGEIIREGMKARAETITIYFQVPKSTYTEEGFKAQVWEMVAWALVHTGVPTEGDYLYWQCGGIGYNASGKHGEANGETVLLWTIPLELTYYTTLDQEEQVDQAVEKLLESWDLTQAPDYLKIRTIYDYICSHVTYDHAHVNDSSYTLQYTAYGALQNGTAVCQGYAVLLYRLALELDVDCRLIAGKGNNEAHGWNIVELKDLYYNVDSTWDAEKTKYQYFLKCEENFGNHTRDEDYDTAEFHAAYAMTDADYVPTDDDTGVVHTYDSGKVTTEATCTVDGVKTYTCVNCGDSYTESIPATGHSYTSVVTAPTCTGKGYTTHTCANCGDSYTTDETAALGHTEVIDQAVSATCTTDGLTEGKHCSVCEAVLTAQETIPATGHSWDNGVVTKEPTAAEPGIITYTCTACGETQEQYTILSGTCGDTATWELNQGVLTISGTGAMYDYAQTAEDGTVSPWTEYKDGITSVVVEDGVTHIGDYAFYKCLSLTSASMADSVVTLGASAFDACYYMEQVELSGTLTSIGAKAFYMCDELETIALPDTLTVIGASAFQECVSLTGITLPEGIEEIAEQTFANCSSLTSVSFPSTLKRIENAAFSNAFRAEGSSVQLTLPEGLETIGSRAFIGAANLTGVTIPGTVTTIGENAFASSGLTSVTIPESVTVMDVCAFSTESLTSITFQGDAPAIGENCFLGATATAYYPADNATWTEEVMQDYGGTITWVALGAPETIEVTRLSGKDRYKTAFAVADRLKEVLGVETFDTIVVAYGRGFADALAGSYLATELDAPILLTEDSAQDDVLAYIAENLSTDGKVYILGGTAAVSQSFEDGLVEADIDYERLSGKSRYDTNLAILKEAKLNGKELLVCTGENFADSLSASATNLPILLVNSKTNKLTAEQETYLETLESCTFYIIGGTGAVSAELEAAIAEYGTVQRVYGKGREATSVKVAETFFENPDTVALAYSRNFPDGLCGGPLAYNLNAPLLLVNAGAESDAAAYVEENSVKNGIVLGGTGAVSDNTVTAVFGN